MLMTLRSGITLVTGDTRRVRRAVTGDSVVTGNRRLVRRVRAVTGDSVLTVDAVF